MHQVTERLADESITVIRGRQEAAALDQRPATGVEERDRLAIEPRLRRADREDATAVGRIEDLRDRRGLGQVGVAIQRLLLQHHMADRYRVPRREAVSPVVMRESELAEAGDRLDLESDRRSTVLSKSGREGEAQVAAADGDFAAGRFGRNAHFTVAPAVGDVDLVVQAPSESVDPKLRIPLAEAGEHDAAFVGAAVAVAIAQEPDVRRRGHKHAAVAGQYAVGKRQPVGEDGRVLVAAVAVAVLKTADSSGGCRGRIVEHLGDIHPSFLVPGDRHRTSHLRLGGDQLDRERGVGQHEGRQLLARDDWAWAVRRNGCGRPQKDQHDASRSVRIHPHFTTLSGDRDRSTLVIPQSRLEDHVHFPIKLREQKFTGFK